MNKFIRMVAMATTGLTMLTTGASQAQDQTTLHWALWDLASAPYWQALIDAYEAKNPNVNIEPVDLGSTDYQQVLQTQLTGGADDLDIVTIKDIPGYGSLIRSNLLQDLSGLLGEGGLDPAAYGGLVEEITVDGKVYGLPFRSDIWVLYYNKDLFDAAGVAYPGNDLTLAQFDDLARQLTSGMGSEKVYGTLFHTWRSTVQLPGILDGEHSLVDGAYEFLGPYYERVLALQSEGVVPSYASLKTSSTHYSGPFFNGALAMLPMGSWFIGTQIAKVESGESLAKNWGIVRFPHPEGVEAGATAATITSLGVNSNSSHSEQALDFVSFVVGAEGAAVVAANGNIPALGSDDVLDTIASKPGFPADENSKQALSAAQAYLEMPVHPKVANIEVVLNRAHDSIMTENVSIDEGIAEMNQGVAELQ